MKEKDLNTIIVRSLKVTGFAHKLADPMGGTGSQNPFDLFGTFEHQPLYAESKIIKPLKAWNFNSIEDHQKKHLDFIKLELPGSYCLYFLGAFESRRYFYLFCFSCDLISLLISENKKSILKKELELIVEKDLFLPIERKNSKYIIDFSKLNSVIITKDKWEEIFC